MCVCVHEGVREKEDLQFRWSFLCYSATATVADAGVVALHVMYLVLHGMAAATVYSTTGTLAHTHIAKITFNSLW